MRQFNHRLILLLVILSFPNFAISQQREINYIKKKMTDDWVLAKKHTLAYVNAIPSDKSNFRPVDIDTVMTFAEQIIHLAVTSSFFVFMATDKIPPEFVWADIDNRPNSHSKDSLLFYVTNSYDYCINAINSFNSNRWTESKEFSNTTKTRYDFLEHAFEHQTHHRGQTAVYLRLMGIKPPEPNPF
jgi:uncharacterized damage-inducible protein DinB